MPPDWDADSPELRRNIVLLLGSIERDAAQRKPPTAETARRWQSEIMRNRAPEVADALRDFEQRLQSVVDHLDNSIPPGAGPNADQTMVIVEVCAWAHAEWVRIHPFANGNGRIARLWANSLALRYGLPPFVDLRPRPGGDYALAGEKAMRGDWEPTVAVFDALLEDFRRKFG